ncbi:UbiA family prenyltransferase [Halococcus sp. IIIV-5B]|uniref:UbiA family prenyltransferase n=1 Tax=Halococcus sp. IIIV-5B TaxID=2321230 RepID=UPI000E7160DC|nr:UbiA family prenyltransferase [Halococcus sp. IIIV-5B]RJT07539.1 hypothetical protein D3261_02795 [Halococcus sp. IIIV-5B]
MSSSNEASETKIDFHLGFVSDIAAIGRLPETLGYNIAYLGVAGGLATKAVELSTIVANCWLLAVGFIAVMLSKVQASLADVIHDRHLDRSNPSKSRIPAALARVGIDSAATFLVVSVIGAMMLWGWITKLTGDIRILSVGTLLCVFGFIYTYPPRIKERGISNHLTTTAVDMACIWLFFMLVAGRGVSSMQQWGILVAVGLYAFGYHVAHQAADTYYDRQHGISTFTQEIGATQSMWLAGLATTISTIVLAAFGAYLSAGVLAILSFGYATIASWTHGEREQVKSYLISRWFSIGIWALIQNATLAMDLFLQ